MKKWLVIFTWGAIISFLGSLPLGTMNVTITQVVLQHGNTAGYYFAIGAIAVEVIYVRIALAGMTLIFKHQSFMRIFEWVTILILLALSFGSFNAAINMKGLEETIPMYAVSPFLLGAFLSLINPLHIPFWFGWSSMLVNKKILTPNRPNYNVYVTGIGVGSLLGFSVFILGSQFVMSHLKSNEQIIQVLIATILLITAVVQLIKLRKKRELAVSVVAS